MHGIVSVHSSSRSFSITATLLTTSCQSMPSLVRCRLLTESITKLKARVDQPAVSMGEERESGRTEETEDVLEKVALRDAQDGRRDVCSLHPIR